MFPHRSQDERGRSATDRSGSIDSEWQQAREGEGKDRAGSELSETERCEIRIAGPT